MRDYGSTSGNLPMVMATLCLEREAEMSSREASVRRILFYLRHGIPADDETGEEKTLRDLFTERLRATGQWPPL